MSNMLTICWVWIIGLENRQREVLGSYRNQEGGKQECWTSNLLNTEYHCRRNSTSSLSTLKDEKKVLKASKAARGPQVAGWGPLVPEKENSEFKRRAGVPKTVRNFLCPLSGGSCGETDARYPFLGQYRCHEGRPVAWSTASLSGGCYGEIDVLYPFLGQHRCHEVGRLVAWSTASLSYNLDKACVRDSSEDPLLDTLHLKCILC